MQQRLRWFASPSRWRTWLSRRRCRRPVSRIGRPTPTQYTPVLPLLAAATMLPQPDCARRGGNCNPYKWIAIEPSINYRASARFWVAIGRLTMAASGFPSTTVVSDSELRGDGACQLGAGAFGVVWYVPAIVSECVLRRWLINLKYFPWARLLKVAVILVRLQSFSGALALEPRSKSDHTRPKSKVSGPMIWRNSVLGPWTF